MSLTNSVVYDLLNDTFTTQAQWLGLHTADPTNSGLANSELTANNYQRQSITWELPSNRAVANSQDITFTALPRVTIPFLAVWSARTGGSILAVLGNEPAYQTASSGSTIYIAARSIVVEIV